MHEPDSELLMHRARERPPENNVRKLLRVYRGLNFSFLTSIQFMVVAILRNQCFRNSACQNRGVGRTFHRTRFLAVSS